MTTRNCKLAMAAAVSLFVGWVFTVPQQSYLGPPPANRTLFHTVALAQGNGKLYNVKELGARGDGASDDTAAIQRAINAAPDGSTIFFPAGSYTVANFHVKNRSGLSLVGEGQHTLIKQKRGAERLATFDGSRDIIITKLAFDANGVKAFGGVMFYAVTGVRIENNSFVDSAPNPTRSGDRYAFVFGRGTKPSQDIKIINNTIENLQLEVDHSRDVVIEGNTSTGAVNTAGIGIFTVGSKATAENYLIKGNTVIDPPQAGFDVVIDPPSSRDCLFRRITIANNTVVRKKTLGYGIRLGTLDSSKSTKGNVFEDIVIKDNIIRIEAGAPKSRQIIFANTSETAGILFERMSVTGNTIENNGPQNSDFAVDLRRIQNSVVSDNTVKGATQGISLTGALLANQVRNNTVHASGIAYRVDGSLGENRVANNRIVGSPRQGWRLSSLKPTDSIDHERETGR
jgi:parallel beta-helix repeat protein